MKEARGSAHPDAQRAHLGIDRAIDAAQEKLALEKQFGKNMGVKEMRNPSTKMIAHILIQLGRYLTTSRGTSRSLFEDLDKDKDGALDLVEIQKKLLKIGVGTDAAEAFLKKYDKDRDGTISRKEWEVVVKRARKVIRFFWKEIGSVRAKIKGGYGGDGVITKDKWEAALNGLLEWMQTALQVTTPPPKPPRPGAKKKKKKKGGARGGAPKDGDRWTAIATAAQTKSILLHIKRLEETLQNEIVRLTENEKKYKELQAKNSKKKRNPCKNSQYIFERFKKYNEGNDDNVQVEEKVEEKVEEITICQLDVFFKNIFDSLFVQTVQSKVLKLNNDDGPQLNNLIWKIYFRKSPEIKKKFDLWFAQKGMFGNIKTKFNKNNDPKKIPHNFEGKNEIFVWFENFKKKNPNKTMPDEITDDLLLQIGEFIRILKNLKNNAITEEINKMQQNIILDIASKKDKEKAENFQKNLKKRVDIQKEMDELKHVKTKDEETKMARDMKRFIIGTNQEAKVSGAKTAEAIAAHRATGGLNINVKHQTGGGLFGGDNKKQTTRIKPLLETQLKKKSKKNDELYDQITSNFGTLTIYEHIKAKQPIIYKDIYKSIIDDDTWKTEIEKNYTIDEMVTQMSKEELNNVLVDNGIAPMSATDLSTIVGKTPAGMEAAAQAGIVIPGAPTDTLDKILQQQQQQQQLPGQSKVDLTSIMTFLENIKTQLDTLMKKSDSDINEKIREDKLQREKSFQQKQEEIRKEEMRKLAESNKEILQRTLEETLGTELGNAVKMVDHKRNNNTLKTLFKNLSDRVEQTEKWEKKRDAEKQKGGSNLRRTLKKK